MQNMIQRNFTIGIQYSLIDGLPGYVIHCREIGGRDSIAFTGTEKQSLKSALDDAVAQARGYFSANKEVFLIDCLVAHWWEYSNTLYSYSPSMGAVSSDWSLGVLEFYIQQFTLGMTLFLCSLSDEDISLVEESVLSNIPYESSDYSELLAIRSFYLQYRNFQQAS